MELLWGLGAMWFAAAGAVTVALARAAADHPRRADVVPPALPRA